MDIHPDGLETFRKLFPELSAPIATAAYERFRQYARLVIRTAEEGLRIQGRPALTAGADAGSLKPGAVDPRTFTKTG
jgi:hypothetical protein